jgi:uncharacterized membrane protein
VIHSPALLALVLIGLVWGVQALEKSRWIAPVFNYLPSAFWCYFLPVVLSTFGLLPTESPVYNFLTSYILCACLLLLLLSINVSALLRLGPTAIGAMAVGALGIALGAVIAYAIFARWLPPETWKGVGALSASWIGGNANMLAVKEGLQTPDSVFAPMVIVDTIVTYSWMGFLIFLARWQEPWDRWVKADRQTLDDVNSRLQALEGRSKDLKRGVHLGEIQKIFFGSLLVAGGAFVGAFCMALGRVLPHQSAVLSASGWAFLIVTVLGVVLSLTPAARLEAYGASRAGYFCLYLLLAAIGAKAHLQDILKAPLLIVMAYCWVFFHGLLLAVYGFFFRIPMFFLVTSSQANIGGTASTPIVAGIYQPRLAPLGLLLAIAGNVIGTYAGILIAESCRWAAR